MPEKLVGSGATPARIAGREMHPDIAVADGSKYRVGQGVETDIGIGVADEARLVRDSDAADADLVAGAEGVYVEALTDPNFALPRREQPLGSG
jgi:hypothetical protein